MSRDPVRYVDGVPRWFIYLAHVVRRRRCARVGHDSGAGPGAPIFTCVRCGQILREP